MKNIFKHIILLATAALCGCGDFDDSELRDRIDDYKDRIEALQAKADRVNTQLEALSHLTNGNVITSVRQDSDGKYVITYKDDSDKEYTVVLATMEDILDVPILGVALDEQDKIYYWTQTVDGRTDWLRKGEGGERIPVRGNTPTLAVDADGFWTVDGQRIVDALGREVEANDSETSVFRSASYGDGALTLTLGNGEVITLQVFDTLNLKLQTAATVQIIDAAAGYRIRYEVTGEAADKALVAVAKAAGGAKAVLNAEEQTVDVTFDGGFSASSGARIIVMAYDRADNVVIKPVFFTPATESRITISTADELVKFAADVNAGAIPAGVEVLLTQDIDCKDIAEWTPIGNAAIVPASNIGSIEVKGNAFTGVFDGGGYTLKNLRLATSATVDDTVYGLFGVLHNAEVRNLRIGVPAAAGRAAGDDSSLTVETSATVWAGVLAGAVIDSKVADCISYAPIRYDSKSSSSKRAFVAMVGCCFSDQKSSYLDGVKNYGDVTADVHGNAGNGLGNAPHVAGVCAVTSTNANIKQTNRIEYCANYGNIVSDAARTACLIGAANSSTAFNSCSNHGNLTNSTANDKGRIGGLTCILGANSSMVDCENHGNITATAGARVGGLVSLPNHATDSFSGCGNYGDVLTDSSYRGVFFGYNSMATTWVNCTAGGRLGAYNSGNPIFDSYAEDAQEIYLGRQGTTKAVLSNIVYRIGSSEGGTTGPEPTLRILCIGNSFTKDAVEHLPKMIAAAGIETVKIVHMYYGGRTVPEYYEGYASVNDYTCYTLHTGSDVWVSSRGMTLQQAVRSDKWDIVTIQEHTGNYRAWSWTAEEKGAVEGLIGLVKADQEGNVPKIGYIMSQAYFNMGKIGQGSLPYKNFETQDEMFEVIVAQAKKVLAETSVDEIIPTGTVLQNLRTSSLDNAMNLTRDGYHMDYGIARYAAACAVFEMLVSPAFDGITLDDNSFRYDVTDTSETSYTTPVTDANRLTALQAARHAIAKPFEVTDMSSQENVPGNGVADIPFRNDTDKE